MAENGKNTDFAQKGTHKTLYNEMQMSYNKRENKEKPNKTKSKFNLNKL